MNPYKEPLYYEIAFGFIDAEKQVSVFEEFIKKYSKIPVRSFLDIGCGPSLQLREIAKRGYRAIGLDSSPEMLKYLREKADEEDIEIETIRANLTDFELEESVDFAFIMMGTISYVKNNEEFLSHLNSVAGCLKEGSLYLIENFRLDWASEDFFGEGTWFMERENIKVKTTYGIELIDVLKQELNEKIILEVKDGDKELELKEEFTTKMIFPQELLTLLDYNGKFEFIGWFERDSTEKLKKANMDNIILLRRK